MELEELKNKWEDMSNKLEEQKLLTDQLIMELTTEKYKRKIKGIKGAETIGAIICGITILFILFNFKALDIWYLQASGVVMVLFLAAGPIYSFKRMNDLMNAADSKLPVKESLIQFAKAKKRFVSLQKISFYMSFFMFFISLLVAGKLMNGVDLIKEQPETLKYAVPIGFLVVVLFSVFVFRKYSKSMNQAEQLLKDLD